MLLVGRDNSAMILPRAALTHLQETIATQAVNAALMAQSFKDTQTAYAALAVRFQAIPAGDTVEDESQIPQTPETAAGAPPVDAGGAS